jgi:hypothetical protein
MNFHGFGSLVVVLLLSQVGPKPLQTPGGGQTLPTIGEEDSHDCGPVRSGAVAVKTMTGPQVEALIAVQQSIAKEDFRFFAGASNSACFSKSSAYFFVVLPAEDLIGVAVVDNGSCHPQGWVGADRELLYEIRGGTILKTSRGEAGVVRGEQLRRLAVAAATRACR